MCFVIGQMTDQKVDMGRLERLRDKVLRPYLEPKGYTVVLPGDPSDSPDILSSVMQRIDTADILVADLTGNNPNVYYELGARHSLGLPYVLVSEHNPLFDLAHVTYEKYPKGRPGSAKPRIEAQLKKADAAARASRFVENPISRFYGRPLAEVSPVAGLASTDSPGKSSSGSTARTSRRCQARPLPWMKARSMAN